MDEDEHENEGEYEKVEAEHVDVEEKSNTGRKWKRMTRKRK